VAFGWRIAGCLDGDSVPPISYPHGPAAHAACAEIRPLKAAESVPLFARQVHDLDFLKSAVVDRGHSPLGLRSLGSLTHRTESQPLALGALFLISCHGWSNNVFSS